MIHTPGHTTQCGCASCMRRRQNEVIRKQEAYGEVEQEPALKPAWAPYPAVRNGQLVKLNRHGHWEGEYQL